MITAVIPQFFTADLSATLQYYQDQLGFQTGFIYGDPAFYAGVSRDGQFIYFRALDSPLPHSIQKYEDEHLDTYLRVTSIETLHTEYQSKGITFTRDLSTMPWGVREFVIKDIDGRLLCFGEALSA